MKFGGTSVKDAAAIERLVEIVRPAAPRAAVVVSALGGVTDRLLAVAAAAGRGDAVSALAEIDALRARHHDVAQVVTDVSRRREVEAALDRGFDEVRAVVTALATLRETSPRWMDAIAATGELLSSQIVAAALAARDVPATWVDPRALIVTTDAFMEASPLADETASAVARECAPPLAAGRVPVTGGFVGATRAGVTTTLGRGGSDFSGALVGAALDADEIQIWTDVDGMLTADPRVVDAPRVVPQLSFEEASELAYFGAKVLHPATILPAVAKDIPVRILNSQRPTAPGTLIARRSPPAIEIGTQFNELSPDLNSRGTGWGGVTAIASKVGITVVEITSTRMLMAHGFLRRLFEVFERHRTAVDVVTTSEVSVSVTVDDTRRLPLILQELREFADVATEGDMAIVCAVGDALRENSAMAGQILAAFDGVPVRMVSQAASRRNVTIVIRASDLSASLSRLHRRFFASAAIEIGTQFNELSPDLN